MYAPFAKYANAVATRTASQVLKGKYVAEVESEGEAPTPSIANNLDDEEFEEDDMSVMSEAVEVRSPATPAAIKFEEAEEEDLYGEQLSGPFMSTAKRRRLTKMSETPISVKSAASAVFSPADSVDTPSTSVSGSIRKFGSVIRGAKRKFSETVKVEASERSDEESEFELSEDSDAAEEEDIETLSIAPTVSSEEPLAEAVLNARRVIRNRPRQRRGYEGVPRLSQWEKTNRALIEFHPELACIWDELETAPMIQPVAVPQPEGLSLRLLPFQLEGLDWLLKQEQQERFGGGILADEMGMGKTIQTIALLLAEPRGKPNLVIAPTVALMQWKQEIETHTNNGLSVCLFYGQNRSVTAKELKDYDVVLTTCKILMNCC
jgi:DNA repair protein RAD16